MRRIRSITVGGRRCRVVWRPLGRENAIGLAYPDQMLIEIDPRWDDLTTASVLVHEYLHKALPDLTEEKVDQMGEEIATMLHKAALLIDEDSDAKT